MVPTGPNETETDRTTERPRVMHIRDESNDDDVEQALDALDRGETPDPVLQRVYHDPDELHRVTRPKTIELLRVIAREEPDSIRECARLVDRSVSQVHRNLEELDALGLVEFEEGANRTKKPVVWYDEINISLSVDGTQDTRAEGTEAA